MHSFIHYSTPLHSTDQWSSSQVKSILHCIPSLTISILIEKGECLFEFSDLFFCELLSHFDLIWVCLGWKVWNVLVWWVCMGMGMVRRCTVLKIRRELKNWMLLVGRIEKSIRWFWFEAQYWLLRRKESRNDGRYWGYRYGGFSQIFKNGERDRNRKERVMFVANTKYL